MNSLRARKFVTGRSPQWEELDHFVTWCESQPMLRGVSGDQVCRFGRLYREVAVDLVQANRLELDAATRDYLNDLVGRAYAVLYGGRRRERFRLGRFFLSGYPRLVRRERRLVACSLGLLVAGGLCGAGAARWDVSSQALLIPPGHQDMTPSERVEGEGSRPLFGGADAAAFSAMLFTHNLRVSFLVFALGLTLGVGTVALMFYNGVPLGALAAQYHLDGQGLFFWAWILPHGVIELSIVVIAGAAGLMLARGMWAPGTRGRLDAIRHESRDAVRLLLGGAPWMVLAGLVEGTISQLHPPTVPYSAKLAVAGVLGLAFLVYLVGAGREVRLRDPAGIGE